MSTSPGNLGRISENAFKGTSGALFGVAIIAAIARTAIQVQQNRRLRGDDYTLIFGCVTFVAASALLFISLPTIYWLEGITLGPIDLTTASFILSPAFPDKITHSEQLVYSYLTLSITTIFSVKLTFIIFFRPMVDKLPYMIMYWKGLLIFTLVSYAFSACSTFIECPYFGLKGLNCFVGAGFTRTVGLSATVLSLDLLTDLMIVAIPLTVLWRVKIRLQQKLILGIFLCLSIVIVIVAIVQVSGEITPGHNIDLQWSLFWQQIEASMAIIVVSITGFRTLLGMRAQRKRARSENRWERLESYRQRLMRRAQRRDGMGGEMVGRENGLPSIPNATLTGMREFINGTGSERSLVIDDSADTSRGFDETGDDTKDGNNERSWTSTQTSGGRGARISAEDHV